MPCFQYRQKFYVDWTGTFKPLIRWCAAFGHFCSCCSHVVSFIDSKQGVLSEDCCGRFCTSSQRSFHFIARTFDECPVKFNKYYCNLCSLVYIAANSQGLVIPL